MYGIIYYLSGVPTPFPYVNENGSMIIFAGLHLADIMAYQIEDDSLGAKECVVISLDPVVDEDGGIDHG